MNHSVENGNRSSVAIYSKSVKIENMLIQYVNKYFCKFPEPWTVLGDVIALSFLSSLWPREKNIYIWLWR